MSERPSDGMELDDLRDEFDWMFEFQSRMAERISGDADVHNLVDYVGKLESENAELREQIETLVMYVESDGTRYWVDDDGNQHFDHSAVKDDAAELRELVRDMKAIIWAYDEYTSDDDCPPALQLVENRLRELGFEVDE